jgi:hypothetical protein
VAKQAKQKLTNPVGLILFSAASITLYFNPDLEDPFNSPKLWLLVIFGSWIAGLLITAKKPEFSQNKTFLSFILPSFIGSLAIAAIFTDVKYTAFFGEVQRRTGLIAYIFFAIYLYASARFFRYHSVHLLSVANAILATALVLYGFIQTTGNDFVACTVIAQRCTKRDVHIQRKPNSMGPGTVLTLRQGKNVLGLTMRFHKPVCGRVRGVPWTWHVESMQEFCRYEHVDQGKGS